MTMTATPRAPWTAGSTPPTLPLQRGGKRRPFFLGSLVSPSFCQRMSEHIQFLRKQESRVVLFTDEEKRKDPGSS